MAKFYVNESRNKMLLKHMRLMTLETVTDVTDKDLDVSIHEKLLTLTKRRGNRMRDYANEEELLIYLIMADKTDMNIKIRAKRILLNKVSDDDHPLSDFGISVSEWFKEEYLPEEEKMINKLYPKGIENEEQSEESDQSITRGTQTARNTESTESNEQPGRSSELAVGLGFGQK